MFPGIVKYQAFTLPNQNIRFYSIFLLKNSKVLPLEKVDRYGRFTKRLHKTRIKWKLKLNSEFPLEYIKRQPASSIFFSCYVEIPWPPMRQWCELLEATSGEDVNYVDLLNATVVDAWLCLN